ncbi:MAG: zf-HC2 domain-containing protein [Firmicutes bacterium]|nr:zf-HC2 domain-containing protein [Bacillota bacterium]
MRELPCDIIEDLLPLYVEHIETEDTRAVVEAHLAGCPVCREKAEQMGRPVPVAGVVDTGILQKTRQRILRKNGEVLGVTAVMVAVVLFWFFMSSFASGSSVISVFFPKIGNTGIQEEVNER